MEILDLYDDDFNKINKTVVRRVDKIPTGANIIASYVLIKNDNKFLLEQSTEKNGFKWAIPGGHVLSGESSNDALERELNEELGLNNINYQFVDRIKYPYSQYIFNIYKCTDLININKLVLQQSEVLKVKWFTKEEIFKMINQNKIARGYAYILENFLY